MNRIRIQKVRGVDANVAGSRSFRSTPGTSRPSVRRTSSKDPENLASRSRSRRCVSSSSWVIERFRACWVIQAESGRLVVPATGTRLVESSMKNST
jgi:hypothetical protein